MKKRYKLIIYSLGIVIFSVACSEETRNKIKSVKQGVTSTANMVKEANGMQADIQRLQQLTPIDNQQLKSWLPDEVAGLKRTGFSAGQLAQMNIQSIQGTYQDKATKQKATIQVVDCAGKTGSALMPTYSMVLGIDVESETEYKHDKTVTVGGIRARQEYRKKSNSTKLTFLSDDRFMITLETKKMNPKESWELVQQFNINKLASLAE